MFTDLESITGSDETIQLTHKEEAPTRIISDGEDRATIHNKLSLCIHPLKPEEHQTSDHLINAISG